MNLSHEHMDYPEQLQFSYPDTNPKTVFGLAKPSIAAVPPIAVFEIGRVMVNGAEKYGRFNYREHAVTSSTYYDAAMRHLMSWWDGEENADDSGLSHLAHAAACLCILLDSKSLGKLNDDREFAGALPQFLKDHTKPTAPKPVKKADPPKPGKLAPGASDVFQMRCVDSSGADLTEGCLYDVTTSPKSACMYRVVNDKGQATDYLGYRFEIP
jgi:hypothetical protein